MLYLSIDEKNKQIAFSYGTFCMWIYILLMYELQY